MKPANHKTALVLLLLLGFIWGTGYSIARFATTHGVPALGYSFWQSLGPALLMVFFVKFSKNNQLHAISHWKYYLICGLTGIVVPNTNMYFAAAHLPAGILAVVVNTVPIFAYILALIAGVEKFNFIRLVSIFTAITGLMLIIIPGAALPSPTMVPWVCLALLTPFSFAYCAVYIATHRPANIGSLSLAAGTLVAASLILAPAVYLSDHFYEFNFPLQTQDWVILLEILLSTLGYVLFFQLIKIAGPVYYSLVDTVVALTGLLWGYLIFHEKLNIWTTPAVLLILGALLLVTAKQRQLMRESQPC